MLETWVIATLIAATAQTTRSGLQKRMQPLLGTAGASLIRFSYGIPFAWLMVLGYQHATGYALPPVSWTFLFWAALAGLLQLLYTVFLLKLFSYRNFAAGIAFSKTEVLQVAIFEALILGVVASLFVGSAIVLGVVAVVMLSLARTALSGKGVFGAIFSMQTLIGLACGGSVAMATVLFKTAIIEIGGEDWLLSALYTAGIAVTLQTLMLVSWMVFRDREELRLSFVHWRGSLPAGFFGALSTGAWFAAFALHDVAPARAVGQIELVIGMAASVFFFRERINRMELLAIVLLLASIIMVLLG